MKHSERTLLHFANETRDELRETRENLYATYTNAKSQLERAEKRNMEIEKLLNDVIYYECELARLTVLIKCAESLANQIEHDEIKNAVLLSGDKVDMEYTDLQELPEDYMTPKEREEQQRYFDELP